jgi:hypothetical protein
MLGSLQITDASCPLTILAVIIFTQNANDLRHLSTDDSITTRNLARFEKKKT